MAGSADIGGADARARAPERPRVRLPRLWAARPPRALPTPHPGSAASAPDPCPPRTLTAGELIAMARKARAQAAATEPVSENAST